MATSQPQQPESTTSSPPAASSQKSVETARAPIEPQRAPESKKRAVARAALTGALMGLTLAEAIASAGSVYVLYRTLKREAERSIIKRLSKKLMSSARRRL